MRLQTLLLALSVSLTIRGQCSQLYAGARCRHDGLCDAEFDLAIDNEGGSAWMLEHSWNPLHCDPCTGR